MFLFFESFRRWLVNWEELGNIVGEKDWESMVFCLECKLLSEEEFLLIEEKNEEKLWLYKNSFVQFFCIIFL